MTLLHCPECSHEISEEAVTCPNCGRPLKSAPAVERKVIIAQPPPREGFPPWAIVPIVLLAVILAVVGYMVFRNSGDQANANMNAALANRRTVEQIHETRPPSEPQTSAPPVQRTTVPGTSTAPPNAPPADRGSVVIKAQIVPSTGGSQAARNTKFYLLDKDLGSILNEARLSGIEGNDPSASLGLALVFPDRYGEFQRAAMKAIAGHVKYSGTTDAGGNANMKTVIPGGYTLFAITRVGRGFALWDSPVSVVVGENVLNLSPQNVTAIPEPIG